MFVADINQAVVVPVAIIRRMDPVIFDGCRWVRGVSGAPATLGPGSLYLLVLDLGGCGFAKDRQPLAES